MPIFSIVLHPSYGYLSNNRLTNRTLTFWYRNRGHLHSALSLYLYHWRRMNTLAAIPLTNLVVNNNTHTRTNHTYKWKKKNYLGSQVRFSCSILSPSFCSFQLFSNSMTGRSFIGACLVSIPFVNFGYYIGYLIEHKNNISPFSSLWVLFFCVRAIAPHPSTERYTNIVQQLRNCVCNNGADIPIWKSGSGRLICGSYVNHLYYFETNIHTHT